jgi:error-prone DNA polymerase
VSGIVMLRFRCRMDEGDEFHHGSPVPDPRGFPKGPRARDIVDPYLHLDAIKVKTRDFR